MMESKAYKDVWGKDKGPKRAEMQSTPLTKACNHDFVCQRVYPFLIYILTTALLEFLDLDFKKELLL